MLFSRRPAVQPGGAYTLARDTSAEPCLATFAADFGHPIGRSFYVSTRWHDATLARHQPGFVLAFASAKLLSDAGYELWDLGGTDSSPGMRYKGSVAEPLLRPAFASLFAVAVRGDTLAQGTSPFCTGGRLCPGTTPLPNITEANLFS